MVGRRPARPGPSGAAAGRGAKMGTLSTTTVRVESSPGEGAVVSRGEQVVKAAAGR
jgi:hypothetical protein